jgi:hypothetical protein
VAQIVVTWPDGTITTRAGVWAKQLVTSAKHSGEDH